MEPMFYPGEIKTASRKSTVNQGGQGLRHLSGDLKEEGHVRISGEDGPEMQTLEWEQGPPRQGHSWLLQQGAREAWHRVASERAQISWACMLRCPAFFVT